jgi:putative transcriptional regulator
MFDKNFLTSKVINSLEKQGYEVLVTDGCFDIVAKREDLLLIKVLTNVDSLQDNQAANLKAIAYFLSAYPIIISLKNNRETLEDGMIYSRFEVPVMTPMFFESLLIEENVPAVQSSKGRHTIEIDAEVLRARRKELNFTLESLADIVGISKKALYEIENRRVNPTEETVGKLERMLSIDLKTPYAMKHAPATYLRPKNEFQEKVSREFKRIGIDNSSVHSAPFEIVGKENFSVITTLSHNPSKVGKDIKVVKKLSSAFSSEAVMVAKKSTKESVDGVPVVLESDLSEIDSTKELKKIIHEKD